MSSRFRCYFTLRTIGLLVFALPAVALAGPIAGKLYYTRYQSPPEVKHVNFYYDGATNFILSNATSIVTLPAGSDGLTVAPDGDLVVGACGSGVIYKVNPATATYESVSSGGGSCHLALDPSRAKAWAGFSYNGSAALSEIPLNPFANGTAHTITGDDTAVGTLAWDSSGNCFYTVSQPAGTGSFGLLNTNTFVTTRLLAGIPAAHGMAFDPSTRTFILFGSTHITQVVATKTNATIVGDRTFAVNDFDQGTVDGLGHLFCAENGGHLLFMDFSASGYITNGFAALNFLDTYLDDIAPIGLIGSGNVADLTLTAMATPNPAMVRSNLTITLTVTNAGPAGATGIVVQDILPLNANFIHATTTLGTVSVNNGQLTCDAGNLAPNGSFSVTILLQPISGMVLNHPFVLANETDPYFVNNIGDTENSAPDACLPPPSGIVGWWPGEGAANDVIGTNNGVLGRPSSIGPGFAGQAFLFDGVHDYLNIPDAPELRPTNLTVECWAMFDAYNNTRSLMGKAFGGGDQDSFALWLQDGVLHGYTHFVAGDGPVLAYNFAPTPQTWYHIAFTVDNTTSNQVLYVNATRVASQTVAGVIDYDTHPVQVGADITSGNISYPFSGRIDEPSLYSRALTPSEIKSIYYAGTQGKCTTPVIAPATPLSAATTNRPYAQAFTLVHASPAFTFQNPGGGLPPGLTLQADGTLSGSPTALGNYVFAVKGTDAFGSAVQIEYTLNVVPWAVMPRGLLAWWRGQNNSLDELGNHDGTNFGGVTYASGYDGSAFQFDGTSGYVNSGSWSPRTRWTVEAWVNPNSLQSGRHPIVGGLQECQDWGITLQDGQIAGVYRPPGGCTANLLSGVYPRVGLWYHVAETVDGTNVVIYVNGAAAATNVVDPNYFATAKGTFIGGDVCCGEYLSALVDEPAIFDRPLTAAEITAIYSAGSAGKSAVGPAPVILGNPTNTTASLGDVAALCVSASGSGSLSYQWYQNGTPVPGATNSCLLLSALSPADSGSYFVAVGNANGTVDSLAATLTAIELKMYAGITINGLVGAPYRIDYANDLNSGFVTLTNITLPTSPYIFIDYASGGLPRRFYKVVNP